MDATAAEILITETQRCLGYPGRLNATSASIQLNAGTPHKVGHLFTRRLCFLGTGVLSTPSWCLAIQASALALVPCFEESPQVEHEAHVFPGLDVWM